MGRIGGINTDNDQGGAELSDIHETKEFHNNVLNQCCCSCKHFKTVYRHPWNNGPFKGSISEILGYVCIAGFDGKEQFVFMDRAHSMGCEVYEKDITK